MSYCSEADVICVLLNVYRANFTGLYCFKVSKVCCICVLNYVFSKPNIIYDMGLIDLIAQGAVVVGIEAAPAPAPVLAHGALVCSPIGRSPVP
jgi:hypothetical protein